MNEYCNEKFPTLSLKPKAETGVLNFLQKYPQYNGENVIIAILGKINIFSQFLKYSILIIDSGVDPNACGLEKLTNGSKKVIERVCT